MSAEESRKVALITGITGQDGSYLTELLLEKEYEVRCSAEAKQALPCAMTERDDNTRRRLTTTADGRQRKQ